MRRTAPLHEEQPWRFAGDARLSAFDAELKANAEADAPRWEALLAQDRKAFDEAFAQAERCGDIEALAVAGRVLLDRATPLRLQALAFGVALVEAGRYAEAAATFDHRKLRDYDAARYLHARARALAGAGRLEEALSVVDHALELRPDAAPDLALRRTLQTVIALTPKEAALDAWPDVQSLVEGRMKLGLVSEAARLLRNRLTDPEARKRFSPADQLSLGEAALAVLPPQEAAMLVRALPPMDGQAERREALALACDLLSGAAPAPDATMSPPLGKAPIGKALGAWRALTLERAGRRPQAILALSRLAERFKHDAAIRAAVARAVGDDVLATVKPRFLPGRTGRLINLVPFNNELTLLHMHLEEMAPFVDAFVIVEAGQTFTGRDKPLHFQDHRQRFSDFADKIVHLPIQAFPLHIDSPWAREFHQRDMAIAAAAGLCGEDDYILETDTDEIVDRRALQGFTGDFACLQLTVSRYFLNYRPCADRRERTGPASSIFKARHLMRHGVSYARFAIARRHPWAHVIPVAGWHFTSVADAAGIALKLESYAHQEQTKARFRQADHFQAILDRIRGGELEPGWERADPDRDLPAFVRDNREALADLLI